MVLYSLITDFEFSFRIDPSYPFPSCSDSVCRRKELFALLIKEAVLVIFVNPRQKYYLGQKVVLWFLLAVVVSLNDCSRLVR